MLLTARISKTYPGFRAVDGFELSIAEGEVVALVGESGSGKSTIARIIVGADDADEGSSLALADDALIAYAPQVTELAEWRTSVENVSLERELLLPDRVADLKVAHELLAAMRLEDVANLLPAQLSTGMRQRLQLARSLFTRGSLLVADEPLAAVDELQREEIVRLTRAFLKQGRMAVLWITHDIAEAVQIADKVVALRPGAPGATYIDINEADRLRARPSPTGAEDELRQMLNEARSLAPGKAERHPGVVPGEFSLWKALFAPAMVLVAFLFLWQLAGMSGSQARFFLSSPLVFLQTLGVELGKQSFWTDFAWTGFEAAAGLALGAIAGVLIGLAAAASPFVARGLKPYLIGATAVPLFVLAPIFIIWFGVGVEMKIALAALSCAPIVALGMIEPFDVAENEFARHLLRAGVTRWRLFTRYTFPRGALAFLVMLRPAGIAALIGAFLGEFISAERGLGYYILLNASRYHVEEVLVGALGLFSLAISIHLLTGLLARRRVNIIRGFGL